MAKFDPDTLKFPKFKEEGDEVFNKDKIDEVVNKIKLMDPSFDDEEVKRKLDVCDKGIDILKEKMKKYDSIDDKSIKSKGKTIHKKSSKKFEMDAGNSFLESKKLMSEYIMKEKKVCDDLENKLNALQVTLNSLNLGKTPEEEEDLKLFDESKATISGVLGDFGTLEEILKARIDDKDLDEDSLSDYEEDLKELRSVQRETENAFDFYLDV